MGSRVRGVVRRPRVTFATIVTAPTWVSALVTTTVVTFVCSAGFLLSPVGQQALVDQWERTAVAFGQTVDDATYRPHGRARRTPQRQVSLRDGDNPGDRPGGHAGAGDAAASRAEPHDGPPERLSREVLAVVSHAGFVLALRQIVATPVDYVRESITSPTTLVQFFSMLDETSPVARVLGAIDLLVVWWLVVLAVGLSVLYPWSARRLTLVFASAYLIVALLAALTMAASGGVA